jgi:antitoxin MazE
MQTTIQKWGNSLGVRIPQQLCKELQINHGSVVDLVIENEGLVVRRSNSLSEMLDKITDKNIHHPLLEGANKGAEEW